MDYDDRERLGWVRLPGYEDESRTARPAAAGRADGVRRVRRASNWTAVALIAGVAAASGYFAHHTPPTTSTAGSATQGVPAGQAPAVGQAGVAGPSQVSGLHQASGSAPMAISGGSGVAAGPVIGGGGTVTRTGRAVTVTWRDN